MDRVKRIWYLLPKTESQIPGPFEWLGMRSWNLSWRNARRHKFAWRGSNDLRDDFDAVKLVHVVFDTQIQRYPIVRHFLWLCMNSLKKVGIY